MSSKRTVKSCRHRWSHQDDESEHAEQGAEREMEAIDARHHQAKGSVPARRQTPSGNDETHADGEAKQGEHGADEGEDPPDFRRWSGRC